MHVFMQVEQNAAEFLEVEFWDDEEKDKDHLEMHDKAEWDWKDGENWEENDAQRADEEVERKKKEKEKEKQPGLSADEVRKRREADEEA